MSALPVLVTCFTRPDLLQLTLDSLKKSEIPIRLFVHIDGPRTNFMEDLHFIEQCKRVIETFSEHANTQVKCQEKNLGVRNGMLAAITWFFEFVESGLIIEEDVVIHPGATKLIFSLLEEFSNDKTIGAISLHNNLPKKFTDYETDMYLSHITFLWGWATWRNRWACVSGGIDNAYLRLTKVKIRKKIGTMGFLYFLRFLNYKARNSWDGDLQLNYWELGYRTIHFKENLAYNMGFDSRATHTKNPIEQRQIYIGELLDSNQMSRNLSTRISYERNLVKYVFGLSGVRTRFQYLKWFIKNFFSF